MTEQFSYTKYENRALPGFRAKINKAESTEDVKKFFVHALKELLEDIFEGRMRFLYEDFELRPEGSPCFRLSQRILSSDSFRGVWEDSDLPRVFERLANSAASRYKHLEKSPEKTDAKIRK